MLATARRDDSMARVNGHFIKGRKTGRNNLSPALLTHPIGILYGAVDLFLTLFLTKPT